MARIFLSVVALCLGVGAVPPRHDGLYPHASPPVQKLNALDYYLQNPESVQYFEQLQQKRANIQNDHNGAPSRLETLEPDSEVELIPGAQLPQQPPQQTPVAPNIPGLLPGQRVFIVHMPVPGYRPGTIGGYQPVYIVAAAPQGNGGFPTNGYQNAVYLDPSGQVVSPVVYNRPYAGSQHNPGVVYQPFPYQQQQPVLSYHAAPMLQASDGNKETVRLSQTVGVQAHPANNAKVVNGATKQKLSQTSNAKEIETPAVEPRA